jgi:hypothetical protein
VITLRRLGQVALPQKIRVKMVDGQSFDLRWDRRDHTTEPLWMDEFEKLHGEGGSEYRLTEGKGGSWLRIEILSPSAVASAVIDPDYRYLLDANLANNGYRTEVDSRLATRGEVGVVRLLGRWLHGLSVFN